MSWGGGVITLFVKFQKGWKYFARRLGYWRWTYWIWKLLQWKIIEFDNKQFWVVYILLFFGVVGGRLKMMCQKCWFFPFFLSTSFPTDFTIFEGTFWLIFYLFIIIMIFFSLFAVYKLIYVNFSWKILRLTFLYCCSIFP